MGHRSSTRFGMRAGVDLVEVDRVGALWNAHAGRMKEVFLGEREQVEYRRVCSATSSSSARAALVYLATRFAAKEAVIKALHLSPGLPYEYSDIEILGEDTLTIQIKGSLEQQVRGAGVQYWSGTASSSLDLASAVVLGWGRDV
jgi:phosphopantetheine--protein transferase-like protein